jgi:hypothetical protein
MARDEAVFVRCDLLLVSPDNPDPLPPQRIAEHRWRFIRLENAVPLTVENLAKIAAAADPWATAIAIYVTDTSAPFIWALVDQQVHYNRWRYHDAEFGPSNPSAYRIALEDVGAIAVSFDYEMIVRIARDDIRFAPQPVFWAGPFSTKIDDLLSPFVSELRVGVGEQEFASSEEWPRAIRREFRLAIQRILLHIAKYRHGGALLISAAAAGLNPKYCVSYERLPEALLRYMTAVIVSHNAFDRITRANATGIRREVFWQMHRADRVVTEARLEVDGCVHFLGSLARVDGLVWLDNSFKLRGFGVEITATSDPPRVFTALTPGASAESLSRILPSSFGMRHRSMMRYCYSQSEAIGFVVSQDGPVRAMTRVADDLILWDNIAIRDE